MSENSKLTEFVIDLCKELSLYVEESSNDELKIFTDEASGIALFLKIKSPSDFSFYYLVRTHDIIYHGDRTDVHVVMSLMFACFLREFEIEISCLRITRQSEHQICDHLNKFSQPLEQVFVTI